MSKYIYDPKNLTHGSLEKIGGKALALAQMFQAGVNVPGFFCLTTEAYKAFSEQPGARRVIQSAVARLESVQVPADIEKISIELREALADEPIPQAVIDEIQRAYIALNEHAKEEELVVAVRSSGTAEDLPGASFAGQHDSFLFVSSFSQVLSSIQKSWISLWTSRAIAYRQKLNIAQERVFMAVVVQQMITSDIAGVLFTINPITGKSTEMLINAAEGVGEGLVSGKVTPDEWIIDRKNGDIIREKIVGERATLSSDQLRGLVEIGSRLEKHFKSPQDVEWAFYKGELFVLQSRPVTTETSKRRNVENRAEYQVDLGSWTRMGLGEWLQQPLSPLFETAVMPVFSERTDALMQKKLGLSRPAPSWRTINGFYFIRADIVPSFSLIKMPFRAVRHLKSSADQWSNQVVPDHLHRIDQLREFSPSGASLREVVAHFEDVVRATAACWAWIVFTGMFAKTTEKLFSIVYPRVVQEGTYTGLLGGYSNKSIEADEALWRLAEEAKKNEKVKEIITQHTASQALGVLAQSKHLQPWYERFNAWVETYGHRVFELDIQEETFKDKPELPLRIITAFVENETKSPELRRKEKAAKRSELEQEYAAGLERKLILRGVYSKLLDLAQQYASIRESRPFYLHMGWPLMRRDVLEIGRRLKQGHIIECVDDVFYLTAREIKSLAADSSDEKKSLDYVENVKRRREKQRVQKLHAPPEHVNPRLVVRPFIRRPASQKSNANDCTISGMSGSAGKIKGVACVIQSTDDFNNFNPGDILVAPYTTPAWTPLLTLAAAVITETGGSLSHAAIIAREYGIPAVVGVQDLMKRISDGAVVEVDGDKGCITIQ